MPFVTLADSFVFAGGEVYLVVGARFIVGDFHFSTRVKRGVFYNRYAVFVVLACRGEPDRFSTGEIAAAVRHTSALISGFVERTKL